MKAARALDRLRRDLAAATQIPYTAQLNPHIIATRVGHYLQVFKLAGAAFEATDSDALNNWHERLNILWRNIASPQVALWTHLIRRRDDHYPVHHYPQDFARSLDAHYRERLARQTLRVNELYLSVIYRPHADGAEALAARLLTRRRHALAPANEAADALEACAKLRQLLTESLQRYDPQPLALTAAPRPHSQPLEFLGLLINGHAQPFELPRAPLHDVLATTRLLFGRELIEYRSATDTRFGAMLGIKEYPAQSAPGMFDRLLAAPYSFVLTQSFAFLTRAAGQGLLQRQLTRMGNAGDHALSQAEELKVALDELSSGHYAFGEHHLSLQVQSEPVEAQDLAAHQRTARQLNEHLAHARSLLADTGMIIAREDLALEAAFWAQLPGNFSLRPRRAPITTRNFAALAPFHGTPTGRADGNHWGPALAVLKSASGSPLHFSLHASDPSEPDGGSRRDTGHTFLCGPTGSGKTVLIGFLIAQLTKFNATQVIFDKDRGLEILVRALGGAYQSLRLGTPTGFNPLQLPDTAANREFLIEWLRALAAAQTLTVQEEADLAQAIAGTLALEFPHRRLSRLIEYLDPTAPEGLHARLSPWCACTAGERAWAFDNETDELDRCFGPHTLMGFDVTEFLAHPILRTPVTLYLFHRIRALLDGRRLVCWMDEFWRLLEDPAFERFAKDGPKTWRKLNAVMCLATQSPADVLASPISRTILEQTPTKIFFPNPDAPASDYQDGLHLGARETQLIREGIEPGSRRFLVKQGRLSVVAELDLKGLDAELAVISGRAETLAIVNRLIAATGPDPAHWLAHFHRLALVRRATPESLPPGGQP